MSTPDCGPLVCFPDNPAVSKHVGEQGGYRTLHSTMFIEAYTCIVSYRAFLRRELGEWEALVIYVNVLLQNIISVIIYIVIYTNKLST